MFDTVDAAVDAAREAARVVDPDALDGPGAVRLLEAGTAIKRAGETLALLAARRLQQTNVGRREGDRTQADYVARKTGTTRRDAETTLRTARHLDPLSVTADALRAGELSTQQAEAITDAVAADPHAERHLVAKAAKESLPELRTECRRVKAAARADEFDDHERIRRSRYVRAWTDSEGAGRGEWRLTPDAQAKLLARLDAEADQVATYSKAAGAPIESRERYRADGLERLATSGDGEQSAPQVVLHLNVDHTAARRGHTVAGESCELAGIGPIPVATALALSTDALADAILRDGADVTHVLGLGRNIPKALRVALEARDEVCPVAHCTVDHDLEIHHVRAVSDQGPTNLENCLRPCKYHHYPCTHQGWRFERSADGTWQFLPPPRRSPDHDPPDRSPPGDLQLAV